MKNRFHQVVVVGASRGIGAAVAKHIKLQTNKLILKQAKQPETNAIPLSDLLNIIDCILSLSRSTCIKEIQIPAMNAKGA